MAPDPKENGGAPGERMDHDAVPPSKKDGATGLNKKEEKKKDDDLVSGVSIVLGHGCELRGFCFRMVGWVA